MCIAYTSDGSRIATGTYNKITMWDAVSARRLMVFEHSEPTSVTFLLNDTHLASGCTSNTIALWDVISGAPIRTYEGHTMSVGCLSVSSKASRTFVSGATDGTIRIWDVTSPDCVLMMRCHDSPVFSVAVLPDGSRILSGSQDGVVRLWDSSIGTELRQLGFHTAAVRSLTVNDSDDLLFASASEDGNIKIYNLSREVEVVAHNLECEVRTIAFSSDGKVLAYGGPGAQNMSLWNYSTGQISAMYRHQGIAQVAFSPQKTRLASGKVIIQQVTIAIEL